MSPMKAACGHTKKSFDYFSPNVRLQNILGKYHSSSELSSTSISESASNTMPKILLLHGLDDDTVPFTSTAEMGIIIKDCGVQYCKEKYLIDTGHADLAMELMLGGNTQDLVMDWIENGRKTN
eukprot:284961_1